MNIIVPDEFICPITHEIMRDPLMSKYGQTYECDAIMTWLHNHNNICPLTRQVLYIKDLICNRSLQYQIEVWQRSNGIPTVESLANDIDDDYNKWRIILTCFKSDISSSGSNHSHTSTGNNKLVVTTTSSTITRQINQHESYTGLLHTNSRRSAKGRRILRLFRSSWWI